MKIRDKRNWAEYNKKLCNIASIDFFISQEALDNWRYKGKRKPGGKLVYSNHVIELCLLMREFYQLPYRQTQGFMRSIFEIMNLDLSIPNYTTISRRAGNLDVSLRSKHECRKGIVVAIDSTGLSLYSKTDWDRCKHNKHPKKPYEKWRKLHVLIDVTTGQILSNSYSLATVNDCQELPLLLEQADCNISKLCGDMAYDNSNCREAMRMRDIRQCVPPKRNATTSRNNRNMSKKRLAMKERDEAIRYIWYNTINGDSSLARKSWKEKSGYHARSLVESTISQIKRHSNDKLTNKREDTRFTQSRIKCKLVNLIMAA